MRKSIIFLSTLLIPFSAIADDARPGFLKGLWAQPDCGHAQSVTIYRDADMSVITAAGIRIVPIEWRTYDGSERTVRVEIDGVSYDIRTTVDGLMMKALTPDKGAPDPFAKEDNPALEKFTHCVKVFTDNPVLQRRLDTQDTVENP